MIVDKLKCSQLEPWYFQNNSAILNTFDSHDDLYLCTWCIQPIACVKTDLISD